MEPAHCAGFLVSGRLPQKQLLPARRIAAKLLP